MKKKYKYIGTDPIHFNVNENQYSLYKDHSYELESDHSYVVCLVASNLLVEVQELKHKHSEEPKKNKVEIV
jgi:hypothetical protein